VATAKQIRDERIADLEERLAAARTTADNESRLREEAAQQARAREEALTHELQTMRAAAADQSTRVASLRRDVESAKQRNLDLDGKLSALQQELEVAYRKVDEQRGRADQAAAAGADVQALKQAAADEKTRADREAHLRAQLEQAARETLQRTADVAAAHQRGEQEARAALLQAQSHIAELDGERNSAREHLAQLAEAAQGRTNLLQQELDRVRALLDTETARADQEAELREQLEAAGHDRLQRVISDISVKYEGALAKLKEQIAVERAKADADRDAARAEVRAVEERLTAMQSVTRERDELRAALEGSQREARTLRHSVGELERAIAELAARYEAASLEARERRAIENERLDLLRSNERLRGEVAELRQALDRQRDAAEQVRVERETARGEAHALTR
jgi:chromosome segregation ATPase